ncbi:MAG: ABC transporter ATP-binding protein [Clostridia bacterium]|nr:ABC transporter ATP-binding protein [Clostridia bacterium]
MGPGMGGPPPGASRYQYQTVEKPKSLSDLPRFLRELLGGFFRRLGYIVSLVWETGHWILILLTFIALFNGIMPALGLKISQQVQNYLQTEYLDSGRTVEFLSSTAFLFLLFLFLYRILNAIVGQINSTVSRLAGELVVRTVKLKIMRKAQELDLASFDMPSFYEKLENANREAGSRPIQILHSSLSIVSLVISFVTYIIILATVPDLWWSIFVVIAVSVPSAVINFKYRKKNFNYMRRKSKERRQMNYYSDLMVNKDLVKEVRMFDLSDTMIGHYRDAFGNYFAGIRSLTLKENTWHVVIAVISAVTNCFFYALIGARVFTGELLLGDYSLLTGALSSIAGAIASLITTSATIYEGSLFIDNLTSFLGEKTTIVPLEGEGLPVQHDVPHTIEFRNVSFSYPGAEKPVIRHVNLTLRPGETAVLVGLNGAGKTTLIKLLTRLYDPSEGVILLDGVDIRRYNVKDLYSLYGIIFQDFGKYAFSVSDNIRFGDIGKEKNDREIENAARQANISDYIEQLPDGYNTQLMRIFEENGKELSIGQWQKLAIARAFYSSSDILILDEPTASLDPMAEQEIFNQFDALRQDKMTIFVSHRLSSAVIASKIIVLEYGEIVEEGTHRELMARKGKYYELFSTQARRYIEGGMDDPNRAENEPDPAKRGPRPGMRPPFEGNDM